MEKSKRPTDPVHAKSIDDVVEYCKAHGVMLYLHHADPERGPEFGANRTKDEDEYHLWRAVAAPAGSYAATDDAQIYGEDCPLRVDEHLLDEMNRRLRDNEMHDISKIASKPVERTFVYFDISDFSKQPSGQQAIIINTLTSLVDRDSKWPIATEDPRLELERSLCIGDGYILAFRRAAPGAFFAAYLARRIEKAVAEREIIPFHFRSGIHTGPVYRFWDGSGWNYVGKGINDARRVLEAIGTDQDDVVFISADTRTQIIRDRPGNRGDVFDPTRDHLQNRGRKADKHGKFHRVYEVNHSAWIGRVAF